MSKIMQLIQRLFGVKPALVEDHLTGAVDLSDLPYCMGLLTRVDD